MTDLNLTIFGEHEDKVVDQLVRCVREEDGAIGVLCADGHFGYSAPIGGVVAYRDHVSPAAVGYDIGCGNLAVATNLVFADVGEALPGLMDRIFAEVSFGVGRRDGVNADHPVIDEVRESEIAVELGLVDGAAKQLGTVGAGNHYVDLFVDEGNRVWIGVHFGSRGLGHKIASHFLAVAARENGRVYTEGLGEMEAPPDLLRVDSAVGQAYLHAMKLGGAYAHAGREVVVEQVLSILGAEVFGEPVHNHHNFAWLETHGEEEFWVVRKGATPAWPGQTGFVGATMGESSVILRGVDSPRSTQALYSTVHGAGRAMSRMAAAGKVRHRWTCCNRDCDWVQPPHTHKPQDGRCPTCEHPRLVKRPIRETEGVIDWAAVLGDLERDGIELRGANAEEAPGAYKRLDDVLGYHADTIEVVHRLDPIGVAMAPGDTRDPYKD